MPITRDEHGRFTSAADLPGLGSYRFIIDEITSSRAVDVEEAPEAPLIMPRCMDRSCTARSCQRTESDFGYGENGAYDMYGFDRDGWNARGLDWDGYGRDGFNRDGFNRTGNHRDTGTRYDLDGYDRWGYDSEGYDRSGYNSDDYDREGYDSSGYDEDGYDRNRNTRCDNGECGDYYCRQSETPDYSSLHGYSYTPRLAFHGDSGPYYGMEIEVTTDQISTAVDVVNEMAPTTKYGDPLIYCKSDASVEGMEMVTHPMSYAWAMKNFPWDLLPALRTRADSTVVASDNGIHVHVGRDGFDNSAHLYRWFKLWYRNPSDMQRIGRRNSAGWGAFNPEHRTAQKEHVKRDKPGYNRRDDRTLSRYSAINTTNDNTLEVRIFASSLRPERVKAALQLVAASVEYTRQLTADDITHRRGWDWRAFMSWVRHNGEYPELVTQDRIRRR